MSKSADAPKCQPIPSFGTWQEKGVSKQLMALPGSFQKTDFARSVKSTTTNSCLSWQRRFTKKNSKVYKPAYPTVKVRDKTHRCKKKLSSLCQSRATRKEGLGKGKIQAKEPCLEAPISLKAQASSPD
ncbi:hypothetical protein Tco_1577870 [Tanacetum coccineum]